MPVLILPVLDLLVVIVFAAIGRRSHGESGVLSGIATTAWPFLAGACLGWIAVMLWRRSLPAGAALSSGVLVWLATVAVGMVLRDLTGHGVAISFVIVSLVFNGVFMLGWRAVAVGLGRRGRASESA